MIPIIIVSYNNHKYIENTIKQINKINPNYNENIIIMDNNSNDLNTIDFLKNSNINVIFNKTNDGPWITPECNKHMYDIMPDKFILTDPDLEFNEKLPYNFIEIMADLSDKYNTQKIGFALSLEDIEDMFTCFYQWEITYYNNRINDDVYELYNAPIDTTFCLVNKTKTNNYAIRIAGDFTAKHLPWYITKHDILNIYEKYLFYNNQTHISSISNVVKQYISENYIQIYKNDIFFMIPNSYNYLFNAYSTYNYEIFDKYLNENKKVIDIGNKLELTSIYLSRKSKEVISIQINNNNDNSKLKNIILINSKNIKLFENVINAKSVYDFVTNYINNNQNENEQFGFIHIDSDNSEEMLSCMYDLYIKTKITIILSIHYPLWKNKELNRFTFLSNKDINEIKQYNNYYMIFSK
jgi:hypothetical protein